MSEEQNKATFRCYVEEAGNEENLDLVDETFDSYLSHERDGRGLIDGHNKTGGVKVCRPQIAPCHC